MKQRKFRMGDIEVRIDSSKELNNKELRSLLTKLIKSDSLKDFDNECYMWDNHKRGIIKIPIRLTQDDYGKDIVIINEAFYLSIDSYLDRIKDNEPIYVNGVKEHYIIIGNNEDSVKESVKKIVFEL